MSIAPIETEYNGIRYRSRLEARWATFLTALRISFHYEYNAFPLPSGNYLPDFYIANKKEGGLEGVWLEIKPVVVGRGSRAWRLCAELSSARPDEIVLLVQGPVGPTAIVETFCKGDNLKKNDLPLVMNVETMSEFLTSCFSYKGWSVQRCDIAVYLAKNNRFGT